MIQVATENFNSSENFLGLGKKNKAKRQERRAARKEKRAAKKEARQGKGLFGKIGNRLGIGKQAKAIRKDFKAAKKEIRQTGTFTRPSSPTIRPSSPTIRPISMGKGLIKPSFVPTKKPFSSSASDRITKGITIGGSKLPLGRGFTPTQRSVSTPTYTPEPQLPDTSANDGMSAPTTALAPTPAAATPSFSTDEAKGSEGNKNPTTKPFNWKLWGGIGGGAVLIIVIILLVVLKK